MNQSGVSTPARIRNPFGVMDVHEPNDKEVEQFALSIAVEDNADDNNAAAWHRHCSSSPIEGLWSSRWNGGIDPTILGDSADVWKQGIGEVRLAHARIYLRFDWDGGRRRGMIDARRDGANRLVGKYINLTSPEILAPWVGIIVDTGRIDGYFPSGRIDFRR